MRHRRRHTELISNTSEYLVNIANLAGIGTATANANIDPATAIATETNTI
jgi:hypothetical protein